MPITNLNKAVEIWMDKILLPITPDDLDIKNVDKNESTQSVDGTPITIARGDAAQMFGLTFYIPIYLDQYRDPYLVFPDSTLKNAKEFTDWLWTVKYERKSFVLTVIWADGTQLNGEFLLRDYHYDISAKNASDYVFDLTFEEYYPVANYEVSEGLVNSLIMHGIRNPRRVD